MRDYCLEVGKQFEKLYPDRKVRPSSVPLANSLRTKPAESTPPDRRVQILVGMLIWLARTARPELSLVASTLGSRVASWSAECEVELERTVGFVVGTAAWTLRMVVRHGENCVLCSTPTRTGIRFAVSLGVSFALSQRVGIL